MADRKQKWRHMVTQPRERKSKKNSTKTQQKQNALTKILITNKKWVRSTRLGTTCSDLRPYKGHYLSADLRNRRCLPYSAAAIPQVRRPRWSGPEVDASSSLTARHLCRRSSPQYCDHWGPTQFGDHDLVVIDGLTRYLEAVVVRGTSAEDNIHALSEIFSRHGVPNILHSDNGSPFNGRDSHLLQQCFKNIGIQHLPNHSAKDPEAIGLVDAFMKHIKKLFHTSSVSHTDPYLALHNHLLQMRATPHPSTAELLFRRKFLTKLPDMRQNPVQTRPDILATRATDARAKERMKHYKDNPSSVKPHKIHRGDRVLLKQKTTKHRSVYDPQPYIVTRTWGTQIEGQRGGVIKRRDAQRWKKIHNLPTRQYQTPGPAHTI